ncbi:DUF58 domain-containing protein [Oscillibacter hominis]|uniref:DUF58 domain-containing protein n=1 Tax=Oscillibacter hominis TaxID=2763056 RepID=A0A7G9B7P4_9FIRM|nr:DUF58 domain-containing protein [Oscillibacter hominis]QNL45575.1 DUF58 domain-containing protein [Oscillibacter hominis]
MRDKPIFSRSSNLVSLPALGLELLFCVLAAFFGQRQLAAALMFVFLLSGISRLWAALSLRRVSVSVSGASRGLFPGETAIFEMEVRNEKFLPVIWLEIFFPLAKSLCLTPEDSRPPDDWEAPALERSGASTTLVGERRFSFLLWYETLRFQSRWSANCRGVYSVEGWRLRTGDGFGLAQVERSIENDRRFAVYPRLIDVAPDLFLRNLWNAESGTRGVMEDPTIIRSTRDYMTTDSLKHMNWRLAAQGLPLTVNVYEEILPQTVHFLFDGESFSGSAPHPEEMEDALSILASELVLLSERQVPCGLSLCRGAGCEPVNLFPASSSIEELLCALAAYQPMEPKRDADSGNILSQPPDFDTDVLYEAAGSVGRFYYISYDIASLTGRPLLRRLDHTCMSLLTYCEPEPYGEFETVCLCGLKEGRNHA